MKTYTIQNKKAWEYSTYDFWVKQNGTPQELAEKIGTKKSYISKLENGKSDVQLSTLFRIFEGLGRRVSLSIF